MDCSIPDSSVHGIFQARVLEWGAIAFSRCKELTHWKRLWCWERLRAGGEGVDRGWYGWMVSPAWWTWVWASSGSWWWTGNPGMLQSMGWQRVGHDWVTELNWNYINNHLSFHWIFFFTKLSGWNCWNLAAVLCLLGLSRVNWLGSCSCSLKE